MTKQRPVDEIFGIPIYFNPIREKFTSTFKDRDYESDRLSDIKRDLGADKPIELEESVIYADGNGEMVLTTIIEISPHGCLRPRERIGYGVSPNPGPRQVFPRTVENIKVYQRHKKMRERGWDLIHNADELVTLLEHFPKNYWLNKAKDLKVKQ